MKYMRNNKEIFSIRKLKICVGSVLLTTMLTTQLTPNLFIDNYAKASNESTQNVYWVSNTASPNGTGSEDMPFNDLKVALNTIPSGAILKLKDNVTYRFNSNEKIFNKDVIIDGNNHSLILSGNVIRMGANVTFKNVNLVNQRDGQNSPTYYVAGYKLVFDNVSTKVGERQDNERPSIYAGAYNGDSLGTKSEIEILGDNNETKFTKIHTGSNDEGSTNGVNIPVSIKIENIHTTVEDIDLAKSNASVGVTSKSNNVKKIIGGENKEISVTFDSVRLTTAKAADIYGIKDLTIKNSTVEISQTSPFTGVTGTLKVEGAESLLDIPNKNNIYSFDDDDESDERNTTFGKVIGDGKIKVTEESTTTINETTNETNVTIKINNVKDLEENKKYVIVKNDNGGSLSVKYNGNNNQETNLHKNGDGYSKANTKQEKVLKEIEIKEGFKKEYYQHDNFNFTNLTVFLKYSNGINGEVIETKEVPYSEFQENGITLELNDEELSEQTKLQQNSTLKAIKDDLQSVEMQIIVYELQQIKISKYKGQSTLNKTPITAQEGEELTTAGLELILQYTDRRTRKITDNFTDFEFEVRNKKVQPGYTFEVADNELVISLGNLDSERVILVVSPKPVEQPEENTEGSQNGKGEGTVDQSGAESTPPAEQPKEETETSEQPQPPSKQELEEDAQQKVQKAEEAKKEATNKKEELEAQDIITQEEKEELEHLIQKEEDTKRAAKAAVERLENGEKKTELTNKLEAIKEKTTTVEIKQKSGTDNQSDNGSNPNTESDTGTQPSGEENQDGTNAGSTEQPTESEPSGETEKEPETSEQPEVSNKNNNLNTNEIINVETKRKITLDKKLNNKKITVEFTTKDKKQYELEATEITKTEKQKITEKLQDKNIEIVVFDLKLIDKQTRKEIKTEEERTVKIALTENLTNKEVKVYYINEKTNKLEEIPTTVENNTVTFKTNHFSKYAVVAKNKEKQTQNKKDNKLPKTSAVKTTTQKTNTLLGATLGLITLTLLALRRKNN